MNAKARATKPQPKPLDPLEEMVREEILRADNSKIDRLCDDLLATRDDRVTKIAGAIHAMIDGVELLPSSDPLAGVPEADSGEALVNRWCVAWDDDAEVEPVIGRVTRHDPDDTDSAYRVGVNEYWRQHASPIERGIPEAIRKAVEG